MFHFESANEDCADHCGSYFGKSTGAGAISVWTHNLKNLEVLDWQGEHYSGLAIRAGAGVQGFEAIHFADTHDLVAVTGSCPTVGLAGGYTQGGGHSSLASKFGLAADNALEFEVVDGSGNVLIANREENTDLFWALSGGGGSTVSSFISYSSPHLARLASIWFSCGVRLLTTLL